MTQNLANDMTWPDVILSRDKIISNRRKATEIKNKFK